MQKIDLSLLNSLVSHFVDIQTSGISLDSHIVEIAIYSNEKQFSSLIKPYGDKSNWDIEHQKNTHKITKKKLLSKGEDISDICHILNEEYKSLVLWTDDNHKENFIEDMFNSAGILMSFKIKNIYNAIPPQYGYSLLQEINKNKINASLSNAKNMSIAWSNFVKTNSL